MDRQEFAEATANVPDGASFIYALIDPRDDLIRYIGKSIRPLGRLSDHMNDPGECHRTHWLRELKRLNLRPEMVIIEAVSGAWPWQESERYWIAKGRALGWPLTNNTSGGDGVSDLPAEAKARRANAWRGRKHRPESLAKIGAASAGRKHSDESKARMRQLMTGRVITWGARISDALYKLSPESIVSIKARLMAGEKVCDLAREFGVHRTTMSKIKMGTYHDQRN